MIDPQTDVPAARQALPLPPGATARVAYSGAPSTRPTPTRKACN